MRSWWERNLGGGGGGGGGEKGRGEEDNSREGGRSLAKEDGVEDASSDVMSTRAGKNGVASDRKTPSPSFSNYTTIKSGRESVRSRLFYGTRKQGKNDSTNSENTKADLRERRERESSKSASSSTWESRRVLQSIVDGVARGVPNSYETLVKLAIEGVPFVPRETSVMDRKAVLLKACDGDVALAIQKLERETKRGWGFVMGKTLLQILGGIYIPWLGVQVVNGAARLQSIWGQLRTVALVAALYDHDVNARTIQHRILFCVLWAEKFMPDRSGDGIVATTKSATKANTAGKTRSGDDSRQDRSSAKRSGGSRSTTPTSFGVQNDHDAGASGNHDDDLTPTHVRTATATGGIVGAVACRAFGRELPLSVLATSAEKSLLTSSGDSSKAVIARAKLYFGPEGKQQERRALRRIMTLVFVVACAKILPTASKIATVMGSKIVDTLPSKTGKEEGVGLALFATPLPHDLRYVPFVLAAMGSCLGLLVLVCALLLAYRGLRQNTSKVVWWTLSRRKWTLLVGTLVPGVIDLLLAHETCFSALTFARRALSTPSSSAFTEDFLLEYALLKTMYGGVKLLARRFKQIKTHKDSFIVVLLAWCLMGFTKILRNQFTMASLVVYSKTALDLAGVVSLWSLADELRDAQAVARLALSSQQIVDFVVLLVRFALHSIGTSIVNPRAQLAKIDRVLPTPSQTCLAVSLRRTAMGIGALHATFRHGRSLLFRETSSSPPPLVVSYTAEVVLVVIVIGICARLVWKRHREQLRSRWRMFVPPLLSGNDPIVKTMKRALTTLEGIAPSSIETRPSTPKRDSKGRDASRSSSSPAVHDDSSPWTRPVAAIRALVYSDDKRARCEAGFADSPKKDAGSRSEDDANKLDNDDDDDDVANVERSALVLTAVAPVCARVVWQAHADAHSRASSESPPFRVRLAVDSRFSGWRHVDVDGPFLVEADAAWGSTARKRRRISASLVGCLCRCARFLVRCAFLACLVAVAVVATSSLLASLLEERNQGENMWTTAAFAIASVLSVVAFAHVARELLRDSTCFCSADDASKAKRERAPIVYFGSRLAGLRPSTAYVVEVTRSSTSSSSSVSPQRLLRFTTPKLPNPPTLQFMRNSLVVAHASDVPKHVAAISWSWCWSWHRPRCERLITSRVIAEKDESLDSLFSATTTAPSPIESFESSASSSSSSSSPSFSSLSSHWSFATTSPFEAGTSAERDFMEYCTEVTAGGDRRDALDEDSTTTTRCEFEIQRRDDGTWTSWKDASVVVEERSTLPPPPRDRAGTSTFWVPSMENVMAGIVVKIREVRRDEERRADEDASSFRFPVVVTSSQQIRVRGRFVSANTVYVTDWSRPVQLGSAGGDGASSSGQTEQGSGNDTVVHRLMSSPSSSFYRRQMLSNESTLATPANLRVDSLRPTRANFSWTLHASTSLVAGFLLDKIGVHVQCAAPIVATDNEEAEGGEEEEGSKETGDDKRRTTKSSPASSSRHRERWQNFLLECTPKISDAKSGTFCNDAVALLGLHPKSKYRLRARVVRTQDGTAGAWSDVLCFTTPDDDAGISRFECSTSRRQKRRRRSSGGSSSASRHLAVTSQLRVVAVTQTSARVAWKCDRMSEFQVQWANDRLLAKWKTDLAMVRSVVDPSRSVKEATQTPGAAQVLLGTLEAATKYVCRVRACGRGPSNYGPWSEAIRFETLGRS